MSSREHKKGLVQVFDDLCRHLREECEQVYQTNLTSLAVFGSVGRGTPTFDSDVDVLLIAKVLPNGRIPRIRQFDAVETRMVKDGEFILGYRSCSERKRRWP